VTTPKSPIHTNTNSTRKSIRHGTNKREPSSLVSVISNVCRIVPLVTITLCRLHKGHICLLSACESHEMRHSVWRSCWQHCNFTTFSSCKLSRHIKHRLRCNGHSLLFKTWVDIWTVVCLEILHSLFVCLVWCVWCRDFISIFLLDVRSNRSNLLCSYKQNKQICLPM
jgi:hypothetical protein